jgi:hypothetical protein
LHESEKSDGAGDRFENYFDGVDAREGISAVGDGRIAEEKGKFLRRLVLGSKLKKQNGVR